MRLSRRAAVVLTAALLGPALPTLASSDTGPVVPAVVETSALAVGATTAAVSPADQLVGVTWAAGSPEVEVRWRTPTGWTDWETAEEDSDAVDPAERPRTRGGTEPLWRPAGATQVGLRVQGPAADLRLVTVRDGEARRSTRLGAPAAHADAGGLLGSVHTRADWGADESMRRGAPTYASAVRAVVVHHTAGSNDYGPADVPSKIRAAYAYHVRARGWSDLGYNLVVDRFGGIWEGRHGGFGRATIGTHSAGFNTGTLGVSLLGDMTTQAPTPAAVRAFQRIAAYAGATWRFDPRGTVTLTSGGSPKYASAVRAVVVHHTAGSNDYGPADVPSKIRAAYAYHVRARGWSDLGYNLVVDRFGGIWEGRHGGFGRATIGTHSAGFNTGTLGVALLGDMTTEAPTSAAVRAFQRIAAYAGATWRFDPRGTVTLTSGGSPKYAEGTRVTLGRVHGHRDTGRTACPGQLYDRLGDIRAGAFALLGPAPRILDVEVTGAPVRAPHPVVITGTLSGRTPWSAAVRDADGTVVARSSGEGTVARLEWNGLRPLPGTAGGAAALVPAAPGRYTWAIRVDNGYHAPQRRTDSVEVALPVLPGP